MFLILNFILNLTVQVSAQNCLDGYFDKRKFSAAIKTFKETPLIPDFTPADKSIPKTDENGYIPLEVKVDFHRIQKHLFGGKYPFALKACVSACGGAAAVIQAQSVFIEPSRIQDTIKKYPTSWRSVIRFLLAHELAHFVHEAISLNQPNGLSPQNHAPLLREHEATNFQKLRERFGPQAIERLIIRTSKSHREVDGIALIILEEMGFRDAEAAYHESKDKVENSGSYALIDTMTRAESIKKWFIESSDHENRDCQPMTEDEELIYWRARYSNDRIKITNIKSAELK